MKYGYYFKISRNGVWLMLNGRMFSFFKGLNTGRWQFSTWSNIWRKTKTPIIHYKEIEMNQRNRKLIYWAFMSTFIACLGAGTVLDINGAANIALFHVWMSFVFSFAMLSNKTVLVVQAKGPFAAPRWLDLCIDTYAVLLMLWYGWIFSAIAYTIHIALMQRVHDPLPTQPTTKE